MDYVKKLKDFLRHNAPEAKHFSFEMSCHSIEDAARAANAIYDEFVKNVCFITPIGTLIVAIVNGKNNASGKRITKALNIENIRLATPGEILKLTGYPCGGLPSFGFNALFVVDPKVLESEQVYTGGGTETSLVQIKTDTLVKLNQAKVVRIRR